MKKWVSGIIFIFVVSCISFSCSQNKSLQELLQEERKAIDRFIIMNDLVILKDYPKDGIFKEKEYFRNTDGLFFQVVDSGNGTRVQLLNDVSVRFDYFQYVKDVVKGDSLAWFPPALDLPYSFVYGIPQSYTSSYYYSSGYYSPMCQAWVMPLQYVGEEAIINMIVPSSVGSSTDRSSITPVFYKNLRYTRFN